MKNLPEVSWITEWWYVHIFSGLYWKLKVPLLMCPNDTWLIQSEVSGVCPLICWHVTYACATSKVKEILCINGYQWYTWWCVKQLFSFNVSPSNYLGMLQLVPTKGQTTDNMFLSCSLDFSGMRWSRCRNCFRLNLLLLLSLCSCRFPVPYVGHDSQEALL